MWGFKQKILAACGSIGLATAGAFIAFPVERYLDYLFPTDTLDPPSTTATNPLTGMDCSESCLPALSTFEMETGFELYSQGFGITDATGVMTDADGARTTLDVGYIAGQHAYPRSFFEIAGTPYRDFAPFTLCLSGLHEDTKERLTWTTRYSGTFIDKYSGVQFRRLAPFDAVFGSNAEPCAEPLQ